MTTLSRRQRWIIGGSAALVMALVTLPLALAFPLALPADSGVSARRVAGTLWNGTLYEADIAGLPLGDTRVAFDWLPLLVGKARMGFAGTTLRGIVDMSSNEVGLSYGTGTIDLAGRLRPLPLSRVTLDQAAVRFRDDRCASAAGRVRADVAGNIGGLNLPGGMSGTLRCDSGELLVPLVGQSGLERIDLRVTGAGKWRADISVRTSDAALAAKLLASGFTTGPAGYSLRVSGAL